MHVFFIHIFHYLCRHKIITTMKYKATYILLTILIITLLITAGSLFYHERNSARQTIAQAIGLSLTESLHTECNQRLLSLGGYIEPDPNPDRKIKTYWIKTAKKDTTYVFEDSIDVLTADFLINQHELAENHPMDINKVNSLLSEKLSILNIKGKTGIIYTRKGKNVYSNKDSVSAAKAAYLTPAQYIDYPPSIRIQAWTDYDESTLWNHMDAKNTGAAICCLFCSILLGWGCRIVRRKEKIAQRLASATPKRIETDENLRICIIEGTAYKMSRQNLQLLTMFIEDDNHYLTREAIKLQFWKYIPEDSANKNINTHINMLRNVLHRHEGYKLITHKGQGYTLVMPN